MADDITNPLTGTDGAPASGEFAGSSGFAAGSAQAGRRARRTRTVAGALAGLAVLGVVGVVAATTGGHAPAPAAAGAGPVPGALHTGVVPPRVVFVDARVGYALAADCARQPDGEGCAAQLVTTRDGGKDWTSLSLPRGVPVDSAAWVDLEAHGTDVMLVWSGGVAVSDDSGVTWRPAPVEGATSAVTPTDFLLGSELVVDPVAATAATFRPPAAIEIAGEAGGQLSDGTLWLQDIAAYGISVDHHGNVWHVAPGADPNVAVEPEIGADGHLVRVSGPVSGETLGRSGDGGELPATTALFSTNQGASWTAQALTGPAVNALCTVFLPDGRLLGVAVDGSGLLALPKGGSAFAPVGGLAVSTPMCLSSNGRLIWGVTFDHRLDWSTDGTVWHAYPLPVAAGGLPTPSPTPSIAR